jgi:uncharacterized HAD superfamily protein
LKAPRITLRGVGMGSTLTRNSMIHGFRQKVTEMFSVKLDGEVKSQRRRLAACERRTAELDRLIKKLFEEHTLGSMNAKRFDLLSAEYEKEQEALEFEIAELRSGIDSHIDSAERAEKFIALTKRYTDFTELTIPMLNEFVECVHVHERAEKKCKYTEQKVDIYLSFIGDFAVPVEALNPLEIEEEAKKAAHAEKVQKRRRYYRDYYQRRKENGGKPLTPEETRTAEQIAVDEAAKRKVQRERRREYEREYHRKKAAERRLAKTVGA